MVAGDFVEVSFLLALDAAECTKTPELSVRGVQVYGQPSYAGKFDAVATCFFLDTAHNVFEYIDAIWNTLQACPCCSASQLTAPGLQLCTLDLLEAFNCTARVRQLARDVKAP